MAARGRKLSGIYIPIGLDTQQINQDMEGLRNQLTNLSRNMSQSFDSALNPKTLINNFGRLTSAIGNVRDAARALENLRPMGNFDRELTKSTPALRDLAQTLGITEQAQRQLLQTMAKTTAINQQVNGLRQLERVMGTTRKETVELARSLGMVIDKAAKAQYMGSQGRGILGAFSPSNLTAGIQSAMGAMGVVGGMYGVVELGKSMTQAALKMENLKLGFESIYDSSTKADSQLKAVREVADRLGLSFVTAAEGAQTLFASMQFTEYAKDSVKVFEAFSSAGAALKLTNDQMQGIFLAVSQVYAKGKVMAEELRGQLSERLPGATALFAKSIGVTTRELDKMLQDGAVGLEHMGKFAEALQEKYGAAAASAATGLQAELNRVSTAWFDLRRAFVDTDELAEGLRGIGSALKFMAQNAEAVGAFVREIIKFGVITGSVYALSKAIVALTTSVTGLWGALRAGSIASFFAALGPAGVGIGALSLGLGGLIYALMETNSVLSEGDKKLEGFGNRTFDLEQDIRNLGGAVEQTKEEIRQLEFSEMERKLNNAKKDLQALFNKNEPLLTITATDLGLDEDALDGISEIVVGNTKNQLDIAFDTLREEVSKLPGAGSLGEGFENTAKELAARFNTGIRSGMDYKQLNSISLSLDKEMSKIGLALSKIKGSEDASNALQKIINMLGNAIAPARNYYQELTLAKKANTELAQSAAESQTAFDAIAKFTKGTEVGKAAQLEQNFGLIASKLVTLATNADKAQLAMMDLGEGANRTQGDWLDLRNQVELFEDALPAIASLAVKSGIDFDTMGKYIEQAGLDAKFTADQIQWLKQVVNQAMNVEFGKQISASLTELNTKIAMTGASVAQNTAFSILAKGITDAGDKLAASKALMKGDIAELTRITEKYGGTVKDVEAVMKTSMLFGQAQESARRGRGGGGARSRVRETRDQISDVAKAILDVDKKIASLQSKYDDDPSIKYWHDVYGEIKAINDLLEKNTGTDAERKKLAELRDQYKQLAQDRAAQMAEEEKRQKAIEAASKFGRGYGNLADVSGSINADMQVTALNAQYRQMVIDWQKALNDKTVSQEQYNIGIENLTKELQIKVDAAEGSMVANFTDRLMDSMEELSDWQGEISDMFVSGIDTMAGSLSNFFITGMKNSKDLGKAFSDMVQNMIKSLGELFMKMILINAVGGIFKSFFGSNTLDSGISHDIDVGLAAIPSAKGNVFAGGSISGYSNSIVSTPTIFGFGSLKAFARGAGLMGEKGPEAVMPLVRTRGGNLGVRAEGTSSPVEMNQSISINILNNTDSSVTAKKSVDSSGNVSVQVMIEKMVADSLTRAGSAPFKAMQNVWRGQTALADR